MALSQRRVLSVLFLSFAFFVSCTGQLHSLPKTRELFSEEVDSFFNGGPITRRESDDSEASASIRSANEVARRPSPFPQHIRPRVVVKNRGQPPAIDAETEPPAPREQPKPQAPRGPHPTSTAVHKLEIPAKRRPSFSSDSSRNADRTVVSFPIVIEPKDRKLQENKRDFPAVSRQHFPSAVVDSGDKRPSRLNLRHPALVNSPQKSSHFSQPENGRASSSEEVELEDDEDVLPGDDEDVLINEQFHSRVSEENRFVKDTPFRQLPKDRNPSILDDRPRPVSSAWEFQPLTSAKTPQKNQFQSLDVPISPSVATLSELSGLSENKRFKIKTTTPRLNNSLPLQFNGRVTISPVLEKKTRAPVITQDLDKFFGNSPKISSAGPKVTSAKPTIRRILPTTVSESKKELLLTLERNERPPIGGKAEAVSDQSDSLDEELEENISQENPIETSGLISGINPQFVDFSTLTTKRSTETTLKFSTPKIRTVVHPPSSFLTLKPARQSTTTTASLLSSKIRITEKSGQSILSQAHLPFPSILDIHDPIHTFVDVPRVGSRSRATRKPKTSTRKPLLLSTTTKREIENQASTPPPIKVNARNRKTNLLSNQNFQRPIFRDDLRATVNDDTNEEREIRPVKSHDFLKSSEEENDEINVVTSTLKLPVDHSPPVITVQRIAKPIRGSQRNNNDQTWKPVIIQQTTKVPSLHDFRVPKFRDLAPLRPLQVPQIQGHFETNRQKRPLFQRKPSRNPEFLNLKPQKEVDNLPTENGDSSFYNPSLSIPGRSIHLTTPIGNRFPHPPSGEEDFPDENSYEVDDYDEEYEEVPVPKTTSTTTTTTTQRPRARKPTTRKRPSSFRPQKPSEVTRPKYASTSKPVKPSQAQKLIVATQKTNENKKSDSSSKKSSKCDRSACRLPYCYCGGTSVPAGFSPSEIPQMILLTFDDAVNDLNWPLYQTLFFSDNKNPNGCPILTTLYVSHEWTDYGKVEAMYAAGHEIASHSISHQDGAAFSKKKWHDEIYGQKEILSRYGGVKAQDIQGMRAPFLAIGGDKMFGMLHEDNFTYDSSVTILENNPPSWPYTLDYGLPHQCAIPPCPTQSFPGLWEIPMVSLTDLNGGRCSMADSCSYSTTSEGIYEMLTNNFRRHYESNRAPLGLFYHSSWFLVPHRKEGFLKFLEEILEKDDVYLVTSMQLLEWMRNPTPLSGIKNFGPWQCPKNARQPACRISRECSISFRGDMRSFRTCGECPLIYPWVGKTNV